jgi:hypothetical protein
LLERDIGTRRSTTGRLSVDGKPFGFTLEDPIRPRGVKVFGQTAIPAGDYVLVPHKSPRFGRLLPRIMRESPNGLADPVGFSYVLVHNGVNPEHTHGCVLLGLDRSVDALSNSGIATDRFVNLFIEATLRKERVAFRIVTLPSVQPVMV